MPIREYACSDCGANFEKIVRMQTRTEEVACPSCGGHHLEKKLSSFAARSGVSASASQAAPMCPGGMCSNPGMCGMNRN